MIVTRYSPQYAEEWNRFVGESKNATFLFDRNYMDYHADRFIDHSLMFRENDKLVALFPASEHAQRIASHGGLTYGGVLSGRKMSAARMLRVFEGLLQYYRDGGFLGVRYKAIPPIYHKIPAQEDLYALFRADAALYRVDVSTAIELANRNPLSGGKKNNLSKARKAGIKVSQSNEYGEFVPLLGETLADRHDSRPAHDLAEIELLASRFPDNINLWVARRSGQLLAGTLLFITDTTIHTQYLASSPEGRDTGALDAVIHELLLRDWCKGIKYFDFGISNEDEGRVLNAGLCAQKEMFGGSSVAHMFFEISL